MKIYTARERHEEGSSPWVIRRDVRMGALRPIHKGIYLATDEGAEPDEVGARWRAELRAHVLRGGPLAAVSHRAAAQLWRFDGHWTNDIRITAPWASGFHGAIAVRSRTLEVGEVTVVDGLSVTTKGRTLADLGRFASLDECELAHQSALRGPDPRRPDLCDEELHAELLVRSQAKRRPGRAGLLAMLQRHPPGSRPTGSIAETRAVQVLRMVGISLDRQFDVEFVDRHGRTVHRYFPDLSRLSHGLVVEIDGVDAHAGADALNRDLRRQNLLTEVFRVVRFSGSIPNRDPHYLQAEVARRLTFGLPMPTQFVNNGWLVQFHRTGARVHMTR